MFQISKYLFVFFILLFGFQSLSAQIKSGVSDGYWRGSYRDAGWQGENCYPAHSFAVHSYSYKPYRPYSSYTYSTYNYDPSYNNYYPAYSFPVHTSYNYEPNN